MRAAEVLQSSFGMCVPQAELRWREDPREQLWVSASWFSPWLTASSLHWGRGKASDEG